MLVYLTFYFVHLSVRTSYFFTFTIGTRYTNVFQPGNFFFNLAENLQFVGDILCMSVGMLSG